MRIRLLAFATAAERLGAPELELELGTGSSVGTLRALLADRHPAFAGSGARLAVAVDGEIADDQCALTDGCEVALLPPVSGGAPHRAQIVAEPLSIDAVRGLVAGPGRGAVVLFLGTVRNHHAGRPVERLTYDAYRPMAERQLARIVDELELGGTRADLRVAIVHRVGTLPVGEPSVVIATASAHRDAAYRASRTALERLKAEVPIWKREHYADGSAAWREEEPLVSVQPTSAGASPVPSHDRRTGGGGSSPRDRRT